MSGDGKKLYLVEESVLKAAERLNGRKMPQAVWAWLQDSGPIIRERGRLVDSHVHFATDYGSIAIHEDFVSEVPGA